MYQIDDDSPKSQLVDAFKEQDALVSTMPGRPYTAHLRIIDAAIEAGVKRFIASEYGNNTSPAAAELVDLYGEKAKINKYLREHEDSGLTWTSIHTGQFFDWGVESGWLGYHLKERRAVIFDSGDTPWSTTNIDTVSSAVVKVLLNPAETKNRAVHVASFTVTQNEVLQALEKATGASWKVEKITSEGALKKARSMDSADHSEGLALLTLMLMYADDEDRGGNFEKHGWLDNDLLGLPKEDMPTVVEQIVKKSGV